LYVARVLDNLGKLLHQKGDKEEARAALQEALAIRRKILPAAHQDIATTLVDLARVHASDNDVVAAEEVLRGALAIYEHAVPAGNPRRVKAQRRLGSLLVEKEDFVEAERHLREALKFAAKRRPDDDPRLADMRVRLGRVLTKLGRYVEAEVLLLTALETFRQRPEASRRYVSFGLNGVVELYDAWHTAEPGQGYDAKAADWREKLSALSESTASPEAASHTGRPDKAPAPQP
jgi:nephrocystin-3